MSRRLKESEKLRAMMEVGAEWGSRTAGGVGRGAVRQLGGWREEGGLVDTEVHPTLRRKN